MENTSEIVAGLQELQNQVKYFHWQTKSYAQHQALAKVFDSITELIDTFVETLMGKYGRPSTKGQKFEMFDLEDVNIEEWTGGVCDLLISFSDVLDDVQDTDLLNLRDEMLQNFNQLKYLLTLKENMKKKKIIRLSESDLYKMVDKAKRGIYEAAPEPEPVFTDESDICSASFLFDENETQFKPDISSQVKQFIKDCIKSSIPTIQKFHNNDKFNLPDLVTFYVGTSSTGDFRTNKQVAEKRMSYLTNLYLDVMGSFGIREDVGYKLLVQSNKSYKPSKIDRDFYDPAKVEPNSAERICSIVINPITTMGKSNDAIGKIGGSLIDASSTINNVLVDMVDEGNIVKGVEKLQTYSDIKDLSKALVNARMGNLQDFLNDQLFDDPTEGSQITNHLNKIAKRSGKGTIASLVGGKISIILENKKVIKLTENDLYRIVKRVISEQNF
jgi:DNA-binding ferritin-like protein